VIDVKVLMATRMGDPFFPLLDDVEGVELVWATTPEEIEAQIGDAEVVYGWPTRQQLRAARRLRWVQTPSAGVEMLCTIPEFVESDVVLTNGRGAHARVIAEHTFGMLLALTRRILRFEADRVAHRWARAEAEKEVLELAGWTIGIVGYGEIGRQVAQRAVGFELEVLAVDAEALPNAPHVAEVWPLDRLGELLERSDVVVIAAPYTPRTRHMIGAAELARMKPGSYLLVVSRGGIVDERAVADALRGGRLAGAGLDVFEQEPLPPDSELWDLPNLIITSHLAGASVPKDRRCVEIFRENLGRYQRGERLMNLVDKRKGY
jgi:phosphoglycerate dehydrogenase-like enzyme